MSNLTKIAIPTILVFILYVAYIFAPSDELGSFDNVRASGEINQNINVLIVQEKGFAKDRNNNIVSFYAKDKNGNEAKISFNKPVPAEITKAKKVELFGHMHENNFVGINISIIELK